MTTVKDFEAIEAAWSNPSVRRLLTPIRSETHYKQVEALVESVLAIVGDDDDHHLNGLLELLSNNLHAYEEEHHAIPQASGAEILRFLMQQHELKQADLAREFGGQGNVSDVLSGKRELSKKQIQALSRRFGVSPAVFFE